MLLCGYMVMITLFGGLIESICWVSICLHVHIGPAQKALSWKAMMMMVVVHDL
jgi:hypothetical protein